MGIDLLDSSGFLQTHNQPNQSIDPAALSPHLRPKAISDHLLYYVGNSPELYGCDVVCNHLPMHANTPSME